MHETPDIAADPLLAVRQTASEAKTAFDEKRWKDAERLYGSAMQQMRGLPDEEKAAIREGWKSAIAHATGKTVAAVNEAVVAETPKPMPAPVTVPMSPVVGRTRNAVQRTLKTATKTEEPVTDADVEEHESVLPPEPLFSFLQGIDGLLDPESPVMKNGKLEQWCENIDTEKDPQDKLNALIHVLRACKNEKLSHTAIRFAIRYIIAHRIIRLKEIRKDKKVMDYLADFELQPR